MKRGDPRSVGNVSTAFFALILAAVSIHALLTQPAYASSAERADRRLDRALEQLVRMNGGPPGAAVLVDRGRRPALHRAGVGIVSSERPIRRSDHMRIASVSKAFSGAVALELADRGVLSLDDTIGAWLPALPAAWSTVTLRQVLNHTAGLPDYIKSDAFIERFVADPRQYFSPMELIGFVADQPLTAEPGSRYEYSDTDNIVVGLMSEAATGLRYETLLHQLVYGQLGLRRTSLPDSFLLPRPYVHGYSTDDRGRPENVSQVLNASGAWASGGMVSTLGDLNRFVRGYASGKLIGAAVRDQQLQLIPGGESGPPGPGENSAGLGIFRYETGCGTVLGATGNMPGYTQLIAATPDGSRSVTVSVNTQLNPETAVPRFTRLRHVQELAVCAALAG